MLASYPPASRLTNDCSTPRYKRRLPIDDPMLEELSMTGMRWSYWQVEVVESCTMLASIPHPVAGRGWGGTRPPLLEVGGKARTWSGPALPFPAQLT